MVLSGAAALIYQVTWVRLLGLTMGSTAAAVATVLSAFFLGMALGSAGVGRLARFRAPSFSMYAGLEPAIVEAVDSVVDGLPAALRDARVRLEFNGARNTLAIDDRPYDVIVSQPSHPWIAGSGKLFTSEFFELVASRLGEGGIFGQWLNLFHMDSTTLRSILQAFYGVFPHGLLFANMPAGDLLLFGSESPTAFDGDRIDDRIRANDSLSIVLARHRIESAEGLLPYFALSRREALSAAGHAPPNTDTRILSEVRLGALDSAPEGRADPYTFLREHYSFDLVPYLPRETAGQDLFDAGHRLSRVGLAASVRNDPATAEATRSRPRRAPRSKHLRKPRGRLHGILRATFLALSRRRAVVTATRRRITPHAPRLFHSSHGTTTRLQ